MIATPEDIRPRILTIISDLTAIAAADISVSDSLSADLGMDSVTSMELIGMLDEELGIEVEMEETQHITTVGQVIELAQRHLDAG